LSVMVMIATTTEAHSKREGVRKRTGKSEIMYV
jgi:hypothetical protein